MEGLPPLPPYDNMDRQQRLTLARATHSVMGRINKEAERSTLLTKRPGYEDPKVRLEFIAVQDEKQKILLEKGTKRCIPERRPWSWPAARSGTRS